ncbi:MAG: DNA repair protein RecO C-terminal domain-containing protein [Bacteroidales bacterium]|nr:DNA repair protein RecO C-terminal domain-containing protein [Bacteroidales bacterium]
MKTRAELIVLNHTKVRDNAIVIHTLSREFGRRSFLVSVRKGASMALFLPLSLVEADITDNPRSQLSRAADFLSRNPLHDIRSNVHKNAMTLFISEVLYRVVREGVYEDGLYEWCEKTILALEALEGGYAAFNTRFLIELAIALGFAPDTAALLPFMDQGDKDNIDALLRYLSFHLGCELNIRSLKVLRELYATR